MKINKLTELTRIDKDAFMADSEGITEKCLKIIASHERKLSPGELEKARNFLFDATANFFLDGDAVFYILESQNEPVSFCMYSAHPSRPNTYVMEMIYTDSHVTNCGYASTCLLNSLQDMKNQGAKMVALTVNNKNASSMHMHNKLLEQGVCKGKAIKDNYVTKFYLDLETLDISKASEQTPER